MFSRLRQKLNPEPESSLALRYVILAAMLVPLFALGRVHSGLWPYVLVAAMGIGGGHWYSYRNLKKQSQVVRGMMFVAIHVALVWMFIGLVRALTVPQAQFAIFAQAITSFDLRHRSSLFNTLIISLAIMYVAASLSRTTELGLYFIIFAALVLAAFFIADKERGLKTAKISPTSQPQQRLLSSTRPMTIFSVGFGGAVLLAIFIIFLFTPRFANRPLVPPFTLNVPLRGGITAEIINPGVPLVQINGWSNEVGDYYFGFDTNLDLRYRGGLSDNVVMYVRSPSRSYWRSHSYDFYNGVAWSQSDKTLTEINNRHGAYFKLPAPPGSPESQLDFGFSQQDGNRVWYSPGARRHFQEALQIGDAAGDESWRNDQQIVQTFTVVREQPNLIFAAYRPLELFVVSQHISLDSSDGIRLPEPLKAGVTYSVVSYRPSFEPDALRRSSAVYPEAIARRYLQLPDNISQRVKDLAQNLTAPYDNPFDKVTALNDHLLTYPYDFFPPPHPPGAEVVDNFLFEDKRGFCEMYVTSLVVMARSLGIPARMTTGYGAGDYNPITGLYEVRFSHAHSWAEVYFPGHGWVPFDPTPGWEPQPYPTPAQNWLLSDNGQLFQRLSGLNLPLKAMASNGATALAVILPVIIAVVGLAGLVGLVIFLNKHLRQAFLRWTANRYTRLSDQDKSRQLILKLYEQGVRLVVRRKKIRQRQAWETVSEYVERVGDVPALRQLSQLAEVAAYRPAAPDGEDVARAKETLSSLKRELQTTKIIR
jgi:hypothetical protein